MAHCYVLQTKGFESQFEKLGIKIISWNHTQLPEGWTAEMQAHALHYGAPIIIKNEMGSEVARFQCGKLVLTNDKSTEYKNRLRPRKPVALTYVSYTDVIM